MDVNCTAFIYVVGICFAIFAIFAIGILRETHKHPPISHEADVEYPPTSSNEELLELLSMDDDIAFKSGVKLPKPKTKRPINSPFIRRVHPVNTSFYTPHGISGFTDIISQRMTVIEDVINLLRRSLPSYIKDVMRLYADITENGRYLLIYSKIIPSLMKIRENNGRYTGPSDIGLERRNEGCINKLVTKAIRYNLHADMEYGVNKGIICY